MFVRYHTSGNIQAIGLEINSKFIRELAEKYDLTYEDFPLTSHQISEILQRISDNFDPNIGINLPTILYEIKNYIEEGGHS